MMVPNVKSLQVLLYNEPVGILTRLPGDKNVFTFDQDYINHPNRPTLSLSFKDVFGNLITNVKMTQTRLPPFFANLLPEGSLREYLAERANINPNHEFFLLWMLGKDLPGALTIRSMDQEEFAFNPFDREWKKEKKTERPFRFSLAGVQIKFSASKENGHRLSIPINGVGGGWIVKLPHSTFREVPENEYTMMELARKVGIDVPEVFLYPIEKLDGLPKELNHFSDQYVYAIKRFDRTENGRGIHIEDFAQVFGVYPEKKYKEASYRNIAEVIWKETGEKGIVEFIRRFVFNALIGNGDMHLKNWSLIYREKTKTELAPAYDFVSTILYLPEDQLALSFAGSKDFASLTLDAFKKFALKAQLPETMVIDTVQQTVEAFSEAWKTIRDFPIKQEVQIAIASHLKKIPLWRR